MDLKFVRAVKELTGHPDFTYVRKPSTPCIEVDRVYVLPKLADLMHAVKMVLPKVQFGIVPNNYFSTDEPLEQLAVYRSDDLFSLGCIGIHEDKYCVYSRHIKNARARSNNPGHHRAVSADLSRIAKTAAAKLRPFSMEFEAAHTYSLLREHVIRRSAQAEADLAALCSLDTGDVCREIEHYLREKTFAFNTASFKRLRDNYISTRNACLANRERSKGAYYVRIHAGNATLIEAVDVSVRRQSALTFKKEACTMLADDLPYDIQAKIATLMMGPVDLVTDEVGVRLDDTHFWVERND